MKLTMPVVTILYSIYPYKMELPGPGKASL